MDRSERTYKLTQDLWVSTFKIIIYICNTVSTIFS